MSTPARRDRSLTIVLTSLSIIAVAMGVGGYHRYKVSQAHFAQVLTEMDERGKSLDGEGCVTAVLQWRTRCEANRPLCDEEVGRVMTHCLYAKERPDECASVEETYGTGQWVHAQCEARGTPCAFKAKACTCATAYRTLDKYCRYGSKGVPL